MFNRLRQRSTDERGFTLIELLVVILIIGILAAIAIPAFLSQTGKASDSAAKTQVGTMQTTIETYANENNGDFTKATLAELQKIEPTLKDTSTAVAKPLAGLSTTSFEVESEAVGTKDTYTLKSVNGEVTRTCTTPSGTTGGGCKAGSW
jgi:type IV pilus assembly protein PilA